MNTSIYFTHPTKFISVISRLKNRIILLFVLLLLDSLSNAAISFADTEFRLDKAFGGRWHDAEKSTANKNDDWLCWASTASNILAWTGWHIGSQMLHEDEIFEYYSSHWSDNPSGSPREAWRWWFTGTNMTKGGATVIKTGGNFWPQENYPEENWGQRSGSLFRGVGKHQLKRNPYILRQMLEDGYGTVLQIVRPLPDGSRDSHMVTLWGFRFSENNTFKGVLVTDSDDSKTSAQGKEAINAIVYYPVQMREEFWWIRYRGNQWKILAAYGLMHKDTYKSLQNKLN